MWTRPSFEKLKSLADILEKVAEKEREKAEEKVKAITKLARLKNDLETSDTKSTDPK